VEVAHGRDKNDASFSFERRAQIGDAGMNFHEITLRRCVLALGSCHP
jgi:hypothetical protein